MENIIYNPNGLKLSDIDIVTDKVRGILLDGNNNLIFIKYADIYMLPGGKVDNEESLEEALIREIKEELGIEYEYNEFYEFLCYENYIKNYELNGKYINKLNRTFNYFINNNKIINYNNISLSEREKNDRFSILNVNLFDAFQIVSSFESKNKKNSYFKKELLDILKEVIKNKTINKLKLRRNFNE